VGRFGFGRSCLSEKPSSSLVGTWRGSRKQGDGLLITRQLICRKCACPRLAADPPDFLPSRPASHLPTTGNPNRRRDFFDALPMRSIATTMQCPECATSAGPEAKFCSACARRSDQCGSDLNAAATDPGSVPRPAADPRGISPRAREGTHEEGRKLVTVLFGDVAGFTSMSERLDAEDAHDIMRPCYSKSSSTLFVRPPHAWPSPSTHGPMTAPMPRPDGGGWNPGRIVRRPTVIGAPHHRLPQIVSAGEIVAAEHVIGFVAATLISRPSSSPGAHNTARSAIRPVP